MIAPRAPSRLPRCHCIISTSVALRHASPFLTSYPPTPTDNNSLLARHNELNDSTCVYTPWSHRETHIIPHALRSHFVRHRAVSTVSSTMTENNGTPPADQPDAQQPPSEHLNIKVTDGSNEVFFKIKRSTQLKKLMDAFCDRQGKTPQSVRFLFDGQRVNATDTPEIVSTVNGLCACDRESRQLSPHFIAKYFLYKELTDIPFAARYD